MQNNVTHIEIKGELSIYSVAALRSQLLDALDAASEVEVDLSAVGEIDSAGVQLMVAAKREAALRQKALRFSGHSPTVIDVLELCKLCSHLGDPLLICSQA